MKMWDNALRTISLKLMEDVEEGSILTPELDRKAELQFLKEIKETTYEASKLASFFEKTHSEILE